MNRDEFMKKLSEYQLVGIKYQKEENYKKQQKLLKKVKELEKKLCQVAGFEKPEYFC